MDSPLTRLTDRRPLEDPSFLGTGIDGIYTPQKYQGRSCSVLQTHPISKLLREIPVGVSQNEDSQHGSWLVFFCPFRRRADHEAHSPCFEDTLFGGCFTPKSSFSPACFDARPNRCWPGFWGIQRLCGCKYYETGNPLTSGYKSLT